MTFEPILLIVLTAGVAWLLYERMTKKKTQIPELKEGERFAILKKEQSNLTVMRRGTEVIGIDEEGAEIPLQITRK